MSMVMEHYHDKWFQLVPPPVVVPVPYPPPVPAVTPAAVEEFRRLLERAREYDRAHGQPDCELDEKRQALKKLPEQLGVEISFL